MSQDPNGRPSLTAKDWAKLRARWEGGESARSIAASVGVAVTTITRRAKKERWAEQGSLGKAAYERAKAKVQAQVAQTIEEQIEDANKRHTVMFRASQALLFRMLRDMKTQVEAGRGSQKAVYALQALINAMKMSVDGERTVLGIANGSPKSSEQTPIDRLAEQINKDREALGLEPDNVGVVPEDELFDQANEEPFEQEDAWGPDE